LRIFDFNIHLPKKYIKKNTNATIFNEQDISFYDLKISYEKNILPKTNLIDGLNIMLFNPTLFKKNHKDDFFSYVKDSVNSCFFTTLIDFRDKHCLKHLEIAYSLGVRGLKFHSYVQNISHDEICSILTLCKKAEELKMFIAIDTSYGTLNMYSNDNLKLATLIANKITKTPIILLHSGGLRVLEAMLLAEAQNNIYLETSFSLFYYKNSSIEKDFAFAYNKIGTNRVLYGSDSPYIDLEKSINFTLRYLQKYNFSTDKIENIFFNTAKNIGLYNE
jgi:predicted TIM-barrel fold metal-dependent hydrolase